LSRSTEDVLRVCRELPVVAPSQKHFGVKCDVSNYSSATSAIKETESHLGNIDILVNCAGISKDGLLVRFQEEDMKEVIDTNLVGSMYMCKAVSKGMIKKNKGAIINIGSVIGIHGNEGQSVYSASKAGIIGFTKSLAKELGHKGITVNVVAPGYIDTDMTKNMVKEKILPQISLNRFGTVEDVASSVLFLANSSYITGQILVVDGGLSL